MHVSLTPTLENLVREKVESGLYNNASEVIREALRRMIAEEQGMEWLRKQAALGFEQLEAGNVVEMSREEFFSRVAEREEK